MDSPNPNKRARMATPVEPVEMESGPPEDAAGAVEYLGLPAIEPPPELPEPRFVHFKILYDPSWNYKKICQKFFVKDMKYLCVMEHINKPNTHVHFQGSCVLSDATIKNRLTRLAAHHHLRKINPKARPTSMSARPVDVVGFQYMAKELKKEYVLAVHLFTKEELLELKEKSVMHCTKLKTVVKDTVAGWSAQDTRNATGGATDALKALKNVGRTLFYLQKAGKIEMPEYNPFHTRTSIIRGMLANPHLSDALKGDLITL